MILNRNRRKSVWLSLLLASLGIGLLLAQLSIAQVSLQEVYDNAGPGEGYDKLLDLDPQERYIGDLWITVPHEVCIHGNGALVVSGRTSMPF